ncbi:MAG: hypothetical protein EAX89_02745 [Candidatus Lokiarchaeota archaeon]|nr:hypothetical protein [Candidatus Lokiarchaeota archaeon]
MPENSTNHQTNNIETGEEITQSSEGTKELISKEFVPHFLPTYRIRTLLFPIPIILVIIFAGLLAYLTYIIAGIQVDGSYFPEEEFGAAAVFLNAVIFTSMAAVSAFIIIFLIKKIGIKVLKYIFGLSFGFIGFFLTYMFAEVITFLIFIQFQETTLLVNLYGLIINIFLPFFIGLFVFYLLFKYFTSKSIMVKNSIVLYISLLISASMSIILPLWTTIAILIGVSLWDIFAVLYKRGPIKEMIDLASTQDEYDNTMEEEIKDKIEKGEALYDTSKLEIGIGDLAFYSLLTSSILIHTKNIFLMTFSTIAIIIGTAITISGLKRNKILPGLPISIFLGIGTFLISQLIFSLLF